MNAGIENNFTRKLIFSWAEFSGGLGDLGLFLPIVAAMVVAADLDLGLILILTGLMNIAIGIIFRRPIPIQPMKAIGAIVITEGLTRGEIAAAGILVGIIFLILGFTGLMDKLARIIPLPLVRGIQLGLGVKLIMTGLGWILEDIPFTGWDSTIAAVVVVIILVIMSIRRISGLLLVFLAGFVILKLSNPTAFKLLLPGIPNFRVMLPASGELSSSFLNAVLPQLPLTILNSVIALCILCGDYFPNDRISPGKVGISIGLINLLSAPFGCIPVCHGAGGLAAQYRFGARSGGSMVMLGIVKIAAGLIFGTSLVLLIDAYPMSILGPMMIIAGYEIGRSARDLSKYDELVIAGLMAFIIASVNTLTGFITGVLLYILLVTLPRFARNEGKSM